MELSYNMLVTSFPFQLVSVFALLVSAFCRYAIMVSKGWSQSFPQGTAWEQTGVWESRSGSTATANYRDRHQGGSHHCRLNVR